MKQQLAGHDGQIVLTRNEFESLLTTIQSDGYTTIGPTIKNGAIVFDPISKADDLPIGWTDVQGPGSYRLEKRKDGRLFGYNNGPSAAKRWIYPPKRQLWSAVRRGAATELIPSAEPIPKIALIGLRPCDLKAIEILDKVLIGRAYADEDYRARREKVLLVAVNCSTASSVCFCTSMESGPAAKSGFDILLTELLDEHGHRFLLKAGSERGSRILTRLRGKAATREDRESCAKELARAESEIAKHLPTDGIKDRIYEQCESPHWKKVAERCLACGSCTLSCPTCFCSTVEEHTNLGVPSSERARVWDSCFNQEFSYIHGGSVRQTASSRYRQWLTHKLAAWFDQFGTSGCVGCGRCIAWCPAGIDITEEARALYEDKPREQKKPSTETKGPRQREADNGLISEEVVVSPRG
ncbi:MAG TPA: 4Fe-4S dicluster domain-containing protein [Fimbriimonadaceae bacterium]|nr:4Fe-4S dicluster domain-containing protein [Fimbriimonadaceae bacterium]